MRSGPPLTSAEPSGKTTIAIGPMLASLWTKPVAKACAVNGWSDRLELAGRLAGTGAGIACCAWVNSGLVEGWVPGWAGGPKLGGGRRRPSAARRG